MSKSKRTKIIHTIVTGLSAYKFLEPLATELILNGYKSEIFIDNNKKQSKFYDLVKVPKRDISFNLTANLLRVFIDFWCMLSLFIKIRPLLVEAHFARGAFIPLLTAFFTRVPHRVYFNHGVNYLGYRGILRFILFSLEKLNLMLATQVITISPAMQKILISLNQKKSVNVLGPGSVCGLAPKNYRSADADQILAAKKALNITNSDFIFFYVGRPVKHKGFLVALESFRKANQKFNGQVKLIMAGISKENLKTFGFDNIKEIIPLGFVIDLDIYYDLADVVFLPSFYEGLPYALLEGGAKKCALVCSNLSGYDQIAVEKKNCLFVDPCNVESIADNLVYAVNHKEKIKEMGENSFEIMKKFERHKIISVYLKLIGRTINLNK